MAESSNRQKEIFLKAIDLSSPQEREAFVAESCGPDLALRLRVEAMLEVHAASDSFLEKPAAALGATIDGADRRARMQIGTRIGPYKLLEQIGEGGMGVVYMAEQQEPVRRVVALKIIKPGMDSGQVLARFEAERQALALMDHPNIARVLDAGATADGSPYFVMELVKGTPITQFCDERRLKARERLELFVSVCHAIQHAHQKGVIHRDIKPSNVLVALYDDKPVPKVIDFGVAKAAGRALTEKTLHTGFGALVGTPEYMSPEQATFNQLDIDTRSDVYVLGVLLYELLTGTTPVDKARLKEAAFLEVLRVVREEEPEKPSVKLSTTEAKAGIADRRGAGPDELAQLLRGELDWIVMKALEKERNRRYETAAGLGRDVERYLKDELVEARPPSAGYRLRKLVKRHRASVLIAATVLLALVGGIAGATWGLVEARHERDLARDARWSEMAERERAVENEAKAHAAEAHTARALTRNEGLRLLFQSEQVRPTNPSLAMLLAIEGAERHPGLLAKNALLSALDQSREERMIPGGGDGVLSFSADGRRLLVAATSNFGLWDVATGKELVRFEDVDADRKHVFAAASFDPNGKRVLTTTDRGRVRLWDAATGKSLALLEAGAKPGDKHLQSASPAQFSPDGQLILTTYAGVRLWDAESGKERPIEKGQEVPVFWAAFSRDGKKIVTTTNGSLDEPLVEWTARTWDIATGKRVELLKGKSKTLLMTCFQPDDLRVLTSERTEEGNQGSICRLWDVPKGKELGTLEGFSGFPVGAVPPWAVTMEAYDATAGFPTAQLSPDGDRILVLVQIDSETEPLWRLFDARSGKALGRIRTPFAASALFSPDGERIAFFERERKFVELRNAKTLERIERLGHSHEVSAVAFSPDGQRVATTDADGVHLWAIAGEAERRLGRWTQFEFLAVSPDSRLLVMRAPDPREVAIWDIAAGRESVRVKGNDLTEVTFARFTPDGKKILFGQQTEAPAGACVADVRTGQVVAVIGGSHLRDLDISPNSLRAITNRGDQAIEIWDLANGKRTALVDFGGFEKMTDSLMSPNRIGAFGDLQFSPDGRWLVTDQWSGPRLRDAATAKEIAVLGKEAARVRFSPDGRRLLIYPTSLGPGAHSVRVLDFATRKELALIKVVGGTIVGGGDPAIRSDGEQFSFIRYDGKGWSVGVWEMATGKELLVLKSPEGPFWSASFSPDKSRIVTAGADKSVRLWDARTGELEAVFRGHEHGVRSAEFLSEGRVLSVDLKGAARIWPIDALAAARSRAPRSLTAAERTEYEVPTAIRR